MDNKPEPLKCGLMMVEDTNSSPVTNFYSRMTSVILYVDHLGFYYNVLV